MSRDESEPVGDLRITSRYFAEGTLRCQELCGRKDHTNPCRDRDSTAFGVERPHRSAVGLADRNGP